MKPARARALEGVACEHCGTRRYAQPGTSIDTLREQLRRVGWLCRTSGGVEIDVCPTCRGKELSGDGYA